MTMQLSRLLRDDKGATMVEYAIMVTMIAAVCILVITAIGTNVSTMFSSGNTGWGG